jgi:hypothetical protein
MFGREGFAPTAASAGVDPIHTKSLFRSLEKGIVCNLLPSKTLPLAAALLTLFWRSLSKPSLRRSPNLLWRTLIISTSVWLAGC